MSFEAIPRVTIEAFPDLRWHVREIKRLVDVLLAEFVISSGRKVPAVVAGPLVVRIFGTKERVDGLVGLEVALASVDGIVMLHMSWC